MSLTHAEVDVLAASLNDGDVDPSAETACGDMFRALISDMLTDTTTSAALSLSRPPYIYTMPPEPLSEKNRVVNSELRIRVSRDGAHYKIRLAAIGGAYGIRTVVYEVSADDLVVRRVDSEVIPVRVVDANGTITTTWPASAHGEPHSADSTETGCPIDEAEMARLDELVRSIFVHRSA